MTFCLPTNCRYMYTDNTVWHRLKKKKEFGDASLESENGNKGTLHPKRVRQRRKNLTD